MGDPESGLVTLKNELPWPFLRLLAVTNEHK